MNYKYVSFDAYGRKPTNLQRDILNKSLQGLNRNCVKLDDMSMEQQLYLYKLIEDFPCLKKLFEATRDLMDIRESVAGMVADTIYSYCSETPLGIFLYNMRRLYLTERVCGNGSIPLLLCNILGLTLESYGYGILLAVDDKNKQVLFSRDLPSPMELSVLCYYEYKLVVRCMSPITQSDMQEMAKSHEVKLSFLKENVKLLNHVIKRNRRALNLYVEFCLINKERLREYSGVEVNELLYNYICISLLGMETTYVFKDVAQCNPNAELNSVVDNLQRSQSSLALLATTSSNNSFDYIVTMFKPQQDALYHRDLYAREKGIEFFAHNSSRYFCSNELKNIVRPNDAKDRFFVREHHDITSGEHILLIDFSNELIDCFIPVNMKNFRSDLLMSGLYVAHYITMAVMRWLGVMSRVYPQSPDVVKAQIKDNLITKYCGPNGKYTLDEIMPSVIAYCDVITKMNLIMDAYMSEDNLEYSQPVSWNYGASSEPSKKKPTISEDQYVYTRETITVGRYTRRLPSGFKASDEAKALAEKYYISLGEDMTLVDSFDRKVRTKSKRVSKMKLGQ